jgi:hypothetical protein
MADAHTFEYDGVTVEYYPAVIETQLEKRRIMRALIDAYGLQGQDVPARQWDHWDECGSFAAQSKADAPWWVDSMNTPEAIRAALECWLAQPPELLNKITAASNAVKVPKKTTEKPPLIPES